MTCKAFPLKLGFNGVARLASSSEEAELAGACPPPLHQNPSFGGKCTNPFHAVFSIQESCYGHPGGSPVAELSLLTPFIPPLFQHPTHQISIMCLSLILRIVNIIHMILIIRMILMLCMVCFIWAMKIGLWICIIRIICILLLINTISIIFINMVISMIIWCGRYG